MDPQSMLEMLRSPIVFDGLALPFSPLQLLLRFLLPLLILLVLYRLLVATVRRLLRTTRLTEARRNQAVRWTRFTLRIIVAILIFIIVGRLLGVRTGESMGFLLRFLNEPFFTSGSTRISVVTLLLMIPVFSAAAWASRSARSFVEGALLSRIPLDPARRFSITSLIRYTTMTLVTLIGLSMIGIDLSSLTVIFGALGIGLGFGLQNAVANFFAGLTIIVTRPIKEGDRILVEGYEGTVTHIRLLSSIINTLTNETIIIPNSQIVQNYVHNYSYEDRRIIIINRVEVSYGSDLDRVSAILAEAARENPWALPMPGPEVRIESFNSSGIAVAVWTWIQDVSFKNQSLSWMNLEIWRRFRQQGVTIPFPQLDLHVIRQPEEAGEE